MTIKVVVEVDDIGTALDLASRLGDTFGVRTAEIRFNGTTVDELKHHLDNQSGQERVSPHTPLPKEYPPIESKDSIVPPGVTDVFEHWVTVCRKQRAKLTHKRKSAINARLKDGWSVEDCKQAIDGCYSHPWNRGQNPSGKKYLALERIMSPSRFEQYHDWGSSDDNHGQQVKDGYDVDEPWLRVIE